jgi:hypothetical protein
LQAAEKVGRHLEWRKTFVEGVKAEDVQEELQKRVLYLHGQDREGHLLLWCDWAKSEGSILWGWSKASAAEQKVKATVFLMEQALASRPVDVQRLTLVINVTDVRYDQVNLPPHTHAPACVMTRPCVMLRLMREGGLDLAVCVCARVCGVGPHRWT